MSVTSRLSSPAETIKDHYDVVVVGSGYGAGIAASRMARAGKQVCILGRKTGLFDFHLNKDINVLVGCGLGGASLINANVSLRAIPGVFDDRPRFAKRRWRNRLNLSKRSFIAHPSTLPLRTASTTPASNKTPARTAATVFRTVTIRRPKTQRS